jgi:hypothetical protein
MSRPWKMTQPRMLPASNFSVPTLRHVHLVAVRLLADALEVQEPEGERERDERGEDAPPEHELVGEPPGSRPASDEALRQELGRHERGSAEVAALAGGTRPSRGDSTSPSTDGAATPRSGNDPNTANTVPNR